VALPGDRVQFRGGILFVNDTAREEPYVVFPCDWESEPLVVRDGHCFVVGDNRSQTQAEHIHGEVELDRISGGVLF
jgi:signal peptidase I